MCRHFWRKLSWLYRLSACTSGLWLRRDFIIRSSCSIRVEKKPRTVFRLIIISVRTRIVYVWNRLWHFVLKSSMSAAETIRRGHATGIWRDAWRTHFRNWGPWNRNTFYEIIIIISWNWSASRQLATNWFRFLGHSASFKHQTTANPCVRVSTGPVIGSVTEGHTDRKKKGGWVMWLIFFKKSIIILIFFFTPKFRRIAWIQAKLPEFRRLSPEFRRMLPEFRRKSPKIRPK